MKEKTKTPHNLAIGRWGERQAVDYLRQKGYTILSQNVHTPFGEIDIIALQGSTLVFLEVKTRSSGEFGLPEEAITSKKQEHMVTSAQYYLNEHPEIQADCRIDVIAIRRRRDDPAVEIVHYEDAVHWN